ncbi:magnesium dechelatase SGRL, chloroplastic [Impatiens glandulifera]|uniref:magnesium dechelatase SGRL, chloroplastic n=1 Tax=Impatiens glandulifera TaxID=253017 RepID=UPI001FB17A3F|nr:magnesium dechelatase SGRL, chloroplastic [Impatiens glandulifera]
MRFMACHSASSSSSYHHTLISPSSRRIISSKKSSTSVLLSPSTVTRGISYNPLIFEAVRLLGPPARFEPSKLKVILKGDQPDKCQRVVPRTYTLSHCDFTADLTLTVSSIIELDQLKGWYSKDDVVAEWKEVNGDLYLDVHCYVSGPNILKEFTAEFRYHIFSKEMPLVLKAVLFGDSELFEEHQELMDALVRVYFHSSSAKYNRVENWGPLRDAGETRRKEDQVHEFLNCSSHVEEDSRSASKFWGGGGPKALFQALFTFLL